MGTSGSGGSSLGMKLGSQRRESRRGSGLPVLLLISITISELIFLYISGRYLTTDVVLCFQVGGWKC
jgi:hypothetical protein